MEPNLDCDCCQVASESLVQNYGCQEKKVIFTPREQDVLQRIREAAQRARTIKETLRQYEQMGSPDSVEREKIVAELQELRRTRAELEKERIAAAEERMRLLGHA